ncbi:MAG: carotenoid 1,2-hydratase [Chloroflexota bacterium]|nr:carotenoid 1,2-hydratase [Chloroflexota bacterium]
MKRVLFVLFGLVALGILSIVLIRSAQPPAVGAEIVGLRSSDSIAGFARADHMRTFSFPLDHGPHPDFQTEWWYYTGNLDAADGRHFGYQLTFFRRAITPTARTRESDWATNQIYFAHFAITDAKNNDHWATERFSRGAAGLAGASGDPYHVWLENWEVTSLNAEGSRVQLRAEDAGRAVALTLNAVKPLVLHGDLGLSQKSSGAGNASYYISFTRLATTGAMTINGETLSVGGNSWMDHEFSTTVLGENAIGWDWFSIQLSDQREVMFFQIRRKDGSIEPLSSGTLVDPDGSTRALAREQVQIQVLDTWTSPKSGGRYPARWSVAIPSADIQLTLKPYIADQEMDISIVYWEGAVAITGRSNGAAVSGSGYVEMTGYAAGSGNVGVP